MVYFSFYIANIASDRHVINRLMTENYKTFN